MAFHFNTVLYKFLSLLLSNSLKPIICLYVSDWYLLGLKFCLISHPDWYLLGVHLKFPDEHPRPLALYMGVPPRIETPKKTDKEDVNSFRWTDDEVDLLSRSQWSKVNIAKFTSIHATRLEMSPSHIGLFFGKRLDTILIRHRSRKYPLPSTR